MDFREIKEFFRDFAIYIITFLIMVFVFVFVVSFQPIAGNSMSPTLNEGNVAVVSKVSYIFGDIHRNDIVTLIKNKKSYIKRIIGLPGETVKCLKNVLYVNDEPMTETFLNEEVVTSGFMFEDICSKDLCPNGVIPDDYYLVLGDNRMESEDSRTTKFGLVSKKDIKGKAFLIIWPINGIKTL